MAEIAKITLKGESEAKNFIDEALRGDIAYEELSTTVSKTGGYVAGDHLIYLGQYYEVVADIAQGGTIVTSGAGQNVEEREVGDEIKKNKTQVVAQIQTFMKQITVNGAVNELDHTGVTDTSGRVKFTVNEDKSITVSANSYPVTLDSTTTFFFFGTNSVAVPNIFKGKKIVGCPSGGTSGTYRIAIQEFSSTTPSGAVAESSDVGEGANISNGDYIRMYIRLGSGYQLTSALTFKPMISLPELGLSYDDYVPYAKTNQQLTKDSVTWDNLSEVGAVNLLNHNAHDMVQNGITFTVNPDRSVTANGTATAEEWMQIAQNVVVSESARLSGCPKGGTPSTYFISISVDGVNYREYGDGVIIPSGTILTVYLVIKPNATVNNIVFKPMISSVKYTGPYVPYAKTNLQLTQDSVTWDDLSEVGAVNPINFTAITPTSPINGVTFTVNSDKSITCSDATATNDIRFVVGTATIKAGKSYRINDLKNGTANAAEDGQFGVAVRLPNSTWLMNTANTPGAQPTIYSPTTDTKVEIIVYINSGYNANRTFYPMLTCATYTGPYVPPAKTNKELTEDVTAIDNARIMYGVENILPNTLESGTAATSVTYTRNSDGTVSVSGSAVGNAVLPIGKITGLTKVRLTGCPSGGGNSAYQIQPKDLTYNAYRDSGDYGEGRNYTLDPTHVYRMDIVIREGYSISGTKLFKPMVVDLSAYSGTTYGDYVPYAKTNKELTDELTVEKTTVTNGATFQFVKYGKVVTLTISGSTLGQDYIANDTISNVPSGYSPVIANDFLTTNKVPSKNDYARLVIQPDGKITTAGALASTDGLRASTTWIAS